MGINEKVELILGVANQLLVKRRWSFNHRAAVMTDQMAVGRTPKVIGRRPLSCVVMFNNADCLEFFDDSIDR